VLKFCWCQNKKEGTNNIVKLNITNKLFDIETCTVNKQKMYVW